MMMIMVLVEIFSLSFPLDETILKKQKIKWKKTPVLKYQTYLVQP